jgi:hypothetical protein
MFLITSLLISLFGLIIYLIQSFCYKSNQNAFKNLANKDVNWYKTHEDKWLPFIDDRHIESLGNGKYIVTQPNGEKITCYLGIYEDNIRYIKMAGIIASDPYNLFKKKSIVNNRALWDAERKCIMYNGDWDKYEKWQKKLWRSGHFYK